MVRYDATRSTPGQADEPAGAERFLGRVIRNTAVNVALASTRLTR